MRRTMVATSRDIAVCPAQMPSGAVLASCIRRQDDVAGTMVAWEPRSVRRLARVQVFMRTQSQPLADEPSFICVSSWQRRHTPRSRTS